MPVSANRYTAMKKQKHMVIIGADTAGLTAALELLERLSRDTGDRPRVSILEAAEAPAAEAPEAAEPKADLVAEFIRMGGELRYGCPVERIETASVPAEEDSGRTVRRAVAVHYRKNNRTYRLGVDAVLSAVPLTAFAIVSADGSDEGPADPISLADNLRYIGNTKPAEAPLPVQEETPGACDFRSVTVKRIPKRKRFSYEPPITIEIRINARHPSEKILCISVRRPFCRKNHISDIDV